MRIFGLGGPELIVIIVVIALLFGPLIYKRARRSVKQGGALAKKGLRAGAEKAGIDLDATNEDGSKKTVSDHVSDIQDRVDKWLDDKAEQEGAEAQAENVGDPGSVDGTQTVGQPKPEEAV